LLSEHLTAAGLTVNGPAARPTAERVLPRAVVDLLALPDSGFDRAAVFRLLTGAPVRNLDGARVPTARWERVSRAAGVVAGDDWDTRLARYAAEQRARADAARAGTADGLREFMARLRGRLDEGLAARDWPTLAGWALELTRDLFGAEEQRYLPEAERIAGERVDRLLTGLAGLGTVEPDADLDALRQVIELELADDLPRAGQLGTGVLVAPLAAAVGLDCDVVFVTGLAEGLYPGPQPVDALLPEAARDATGGALPALRDHLDRRLRHLLAAFAAAPRVVASFPRGDLRQSNVRLPSRWLLPTLRALGDDPDLAAVGWSRVQSFMYESPSFSASLLSTADPATDQEWRVQAVASARTLGSADPLVDDTAVARARALLRARAGDAFTRFDGNLSAHAADMPDPAGDRIVSATQLESWVACPHAYFVRRLLGVEPVEQPEELVEMSALERGSFLHEALDRFFAWLTETGAVPGPHEPWTTAQRERLARIGRDLAGECEQRGVTGHPTLWARDRARLVADLDRVLDQDELRRAQLGARQLRSELLFGQGRWPDPVAVALPDGRRIRFRGSADRIDLTDDGRIIVVDYKSGSTRHYQGLGEDDPDLAGSRLQLPLYAYAARQRLRRPDAVVRAEYWFVGRHDPGRRIGYDVTPRVEERFAHVLAVIADGIAAGVFPHRAPEDQPWLDWVACGYCDPDGLGAKRRRDEWARKKHAPELAGYLGLIEPQPAPAPKAAHP
jgi:RecB family exonuclease